MPQHSLTLTVLLGAVLTPCYLAEIRIASGAQISINGEVTTNAIRIQNGGTLTGEGQTKGSIITESGGILSPGGSPGTFTTTGTTTLAGTLRCEVDSSDSDQLTTQGTLDLSGATLQLDNLSGGNLQPVYLLASYGSLSGVSFSQVINLPPGYVIDYSYFDGSNLNNIALTANTAPYQTWALSSGLTPGVNDGINNDLNQDGIPNLIHFAYNTNPLGNGSSEGKRQISAIQIGDEQYLSITFPARVARLSQEHPASLRQSMESVLASAATANWTRHGICPWSNSSRLSTVASLPSATATVTDRPTGNTALSASASPCRYIQTASCN